MRKFQEYKDQQQWEIKLSLYEFCDHVYFETEFAKWEHRVQETHQNEVNQIKQEYKKAMASVTTEALAAGYDPTEIFADQNDEACQVTNKMYAGLVVALWSYTEINLRNLVLISQEASGSPTTKVYRFDDIKRAFNRTLDENAKLARDCPSYEKMNSTRLLCNAFKHNEGKCDARTFSKLDSTVRDTANIETNKVINYSALEIEDLAKGCQDSIAWIVQKIKDRASGGSRLDKRFSFLEFCRRVFGCLPG